jgi:thioredoxin-like negative regulator of GroEL
VEPGDDRLAATPGTMATFTAGLGRLEANDPEGAATAFRTVLKAAPEFTPALIALGACYAAGGNDAEAAGTWQKVLANDTVSPVVQRLAIEAWLRADRPAAAGPLIEQARQRWPDDAGFVPLQAQAALADGRIQDGLQLIASAAPSDPATLLAGLGALYDAWRRRAPVWSASRDLETARRLRDAYAAQHPTDALGLVDVWIGEMAKGAGR